MLLGHLRDEQVVRVLEDLRGRHQPRRIAAQDAVGPGHDQRSRHALVGDVADDDPDPPVGQLHEVVEVATDRAGRPVVGGDLPVGQVRQLRAAGTVAG